MSAVLKRVGAKYIRVLRLTLDHIAQQMEIDAIYMATMIIHAISGVRLIPIHALLPVVNSGFPSAALSSRCREGYER